MTIELDGGCYVHRRRWGTWKYAGYAYLPFLILKVIKASSSKLSFKVNILFGDGYSNEFKFIGVASIKLWSCKINHNIFQNMIPLQLLNVIDKMSHKYVYTWVFTQCMLNC